MSPEFAQGKKTLIVRDGKFILPTEQNASRTIELETSQNIVPRDFSNTDIETIIIRVLAFNDGRAFSLAKSIRSSGFTGILRMKGPMIADQYPLAIRCGFDELEIPVDEANRQPEIQWIEALNRIRNNYLDKLIKAGTDKNQQKLLSA